jgi:SAM-dependent methyltransferase
LSSAETQTAANRFRFLAEAAAWRYRAQGFWIQRAVRKELLREPFYRELLAAGRLPQEGLLLDLGCGRGILLALLACVYSGAVGTSELRTKLRLSGIEQDAGKAEMARAALAGKADIITCALGDAAPPPCRAAIALDALFRLPTDQQDRLLECLSAALQEGGVLLLREPDAGAFGCRFGLRLLANLRGLLRGKRAGRIHPRSSEEWKQRLSDLGLRVESVQTGGKMASAKVLLMAKKDSG